MHLNSIVETVLYVFYEAILNKSVYSLQFIDLLHQNAHKQRSDVPHPQLTQV